MNILDARTADGELIGQVGFDPAADVYSFEYSADWKNAEASYPISPAIQFDGLASSTTVKRFIENLLPEGAGLDAIAQTNHLSKSNIYGLIRVVGKESTGAIMLVSPDVASQDSSQNSPLRPVESAELLSRIHARASIPFSVWDGKVRLSIAGYQDKIAVFMNEGKMFLADHPLASTHIIKPLPQKAELSTVVANEHFCMNLAGLCKLTAAKVKIIRLPDPVLVVERFDRKLHVDPLRVERLHVIDACQLLDLHPGYKYERNFGNGKDVAHVRDGASLKRIFAKSTLSHSPILFTQQMLRWVLFQYLIGNADAHGKNISFFAKKHGKIALSPAYDIVSTVIYNGLADELAMGIGDEFKLSDIGAYQWVCFAQECGITIRTLAKEMNFMAANVVKNLPVEAEKYTPEEIKVIERIREFATQQASLMHKAATQLADVAQLTR